MSLRPIGSAVLLLALLSAFPAGGFSDEPKEADPLPLSAELEESIRDARQRIGLVDSQIAALEDEENKLMAQMRDSQRSRFEIHQQIMADDEEIREMAGRIESLQRDLHSLQETLAKRMAEHPDYAAHQERQIADMERSGAIQREIAVLANDRVRIQLELQALEKQMAESAKGLAKGAGASALESDGAGATVSAEGSD